jgi:hypothetical protein
MQSTALILVFLASACASSTPSADDGAAGAASTSECPVDEASIDDYCQTNQLCVPLSEWKCMKTSFIPSEEIEKGCGFVRFTYTGDVGDNWGRVYAADSGQLVYVWHNGHFSAGCGRGMRVGTEPKCDAWEPSACQ